MTLHQHPASHRGILIRGGLLVVAVALSTAACGSDDKSGGPTGSGPVTTPASAAGGSSSDPSTATSGGADSSGGTAATGACVKDSNYMSGTSTVVWTPDAKSKYRDAEAKADHKFALKADGMLEPSTIHVGVNEVFTVTPTADSDLVSVMTIGCDSGQTMYRSGPAGVYITSPGTYPVTSGFGSDPAGTIVVE